MEGPILECQNLGKRYGKINAIGGISFQMASGRIVGLLGPNGSGKTTFIKLVNGLLQPSSGDLRVAGMRPGTATKEIVSYLPDRDYLDPNSTFRQSAALFKDFYRDFDIQKAYDMLERLNVDPKARFKTLSKGNREKIQLILVMSRQAKLYMLDEPIAGVDPATRDYILQTIISNYNPEATVVISTHLIADVEKVLDDVLFLKNGEIVLYNDADAVRKEYGKSVDEVFREVFACF